MKSIITQLLLIPAAFLFSMALAWIPMLGWNHGVTHIWTDLPQIDYWTAFWLSFCLTYLKTSVVTIKE
jgi:hypothetical protein